MMKNLFPWRGASRLAGTSIAIMTAAALMIVSFLASNVSLASKVSRHYYLTRIFQANAGEAEALPPMVHQGIVLVRAHHLQSVDISQRLWDQVEIRQRFAEGMYPIRLERNSRFVLVGSDEGSASRCRVLGEQPLVRLVEC